MVCPCRILKSYAMHQNSKIQIRIFILLPRADVHLLLLVISFILFKESHFPWMNLQKEQTGTFRSKKYLKKVEQNVRFF